MDELNSVEYPVTQQLRDLWVYMERNKAKIDMLQQDLNNQRWLMHKVLNHLGKANLLDEKEPKD